MLFVVAELTPHALDAVTLKLPLVAVVEKLVVIAFVPAPVFRETPLGKDQLYAVASVTVFTKNDSAVCPWQIVEFPKIEIGAVGIVMTFIYAVLISVFKPDKLLIVNVTVFGPTEE